MTADEILVLIALLYDAGCCDSMILAVAALCCPPVECPVVPNIRFCLTAATDMDAEFDFLSKLLSCSKAVDTLVS
ncbi:hypothetical protein PC128_g26019 [Phytophthora cactorum]|uniref:Secreted protein n=1 Tax=Phytophthora cactorum TaxID=29920 RepID=A0A8T1BBM0_9STRA|nr:hypothetical protein PC117_g22527 [Phytophthora cactorum]KAG2979032.1 hypothetical protein PC120_g25205 [Phytophthora cactorum]KAG3135694.1 hypothetical protein PC128_g26019 [Phytophthora cactorum]